ncbi:hypothetical protein K402DRAFT_60836 [Aulographum hederae CBS 113979]|uniref:Uncharacterized protein n=1 Tax=Aulographum hederae CBS 113979 TaxID=1176131 RepID=A0A6G1H193_9PEZI|nr:hypothetical protein K402DRAFT_60836 [Aulographum hederae CBS 113979]
MPENSATHWICHRCQWTWFHIYEQCGNADCQHHRCGICVMGTLSGLNATFSKQSTGPHSLPDSGKEQQANVGKINSDSSASNVEDRPYSLQAGSSSQSSRNSDPTEAKPRSPSLPPNRTDSRPNAAKKTTADIVMDAIVDSSKHFREPDEMERRVLALTQVKELIMVNEYHFKTFEGFTLSRFQNCLQNLQEAVEVLRAYGHCDDKINFLTVDNSPPNVVRVVEIEVASLAQLIDAVKISVNDRKHLSSVQRISSTLLQGFPLSSLGTSTPFCQAPQLIRENGLVGNDSFGVDDAYLFLYVCLALAIASYSGDHVSPFLDNTHEVYWHTKVFIRAQMSCLRSMVKGPVWIFREANSRKPSAGYDVSITTSHINDLWGPFWTKNFIDQSDGWINCLRDELGAIVRSSHDTSPFGEIICHWYLEPEFEQFLRDSIREKWESFPYEGSTRLLIGAAPESPLDSLTRNAHCKTTIPDLQKRYGHQLGFPGTSKAYYESDLVQISGNGGKYLPLGLAKTYRKKSNFDLENNVVLLVRQ